MPDIRKAILSRISNNRIQHLTSGNGVRRDYYPLDPQVVKDYNRARPHGPQDLLCYAPFKNIYFGTNGNATACCYNREHLLGTYPKDSLREMWFGDNAQQLREYIEHNDLSKGCIGCSHHFNAGNYTGVQAKDFDHYPSSIVGYPTVMSFELSNTCNLECEMCNGEFSSLIRKNREQREPLPDPYDHAFLKQLVEFIPHLHYTKFYGGEPFLINTYYKIWELIALIDPTIRVEVQTNATVLNGRVKDTLRKLKFNINISLDSLDKDTYESIRVNASFDRVMKNVAYFSKYCKDTGTKLFISVCPMRQNWRELPDLVRYCNDLGAPIYFHLVWSPDHCALWNLDPDNLNGIIGHLSGHKMPRNTRLEKYNADHYRDLIKQIGKWREDALHKEEQRTMEEEEARRRQIRDEDMGRRKDALKGKVRLHGAKDTLLAEVRNYFKTSDRPSQLRTAETEADHLSKLERVLNRLADDLDIEDLCKHLLYKRPVGDLIDELEHRTTDELCAIAVGFNARMLETTIEDG